MQKNSLESLLRDAKQLEKKYEWLQAAKLYGKASDLSLDAKNILEAADSQSKSGYSYFRAALQSSTNQQFQNRMSKAFEANTKASCLFQKPKVKKYQAKAISCQARAVYTASWIETNPARKRKLLDDWWSLNFKAIALFEELGDQLAIATLCNDIMEGSFDCKFWIALNWVKSLKIRNELLSLGKRALAILSKLDDIYQLARTYRWLGYYQLTNNRGDSYVREKHLIEKGFDYLNKALEYSKRTGDSWLVGWSHMLLMRYAGRINDYSMANKSVRKMIEYGEIAKDNYLTGMGKLLLLVLGYLFFSRVEDPDKQREIVKHNLKLIPETIHHLEIINMVVWNANLSSCYTVLNAASLALDVNEKKAYLKKAVEYGRKSVEELEEYHQSNIPMMISSYSRALYQLSEIENNSIKKEQILEDLLNNTSKGLKILQAYPEDTYFKISLQSWMILVKVELAKMSAVNKINLLKNAVASIDHCFLAIRTYIEPGPPDIFLPWLGVLLYKFGSVYNQLFSLTKEKELLSSAIEVYDFALSIFDRIGLTTRIAESYWQKAKIQDQLGECVEAAKNFNLASEAYSKAAQKIPKLNEFYENHSQYMCAWGNIEQARYNHSKEDYARAMEFYREAAYLHEKSKLWSYLAPNYYAWEQLERGEDFSRKEEPQEAIEGFSLADEYFHKTEESIKNEIPSLQSSEEKELASKLLKASDLRRIYCRARICIEEAKMFDIQGEYSSSSRNFGKAATSVSKIIEGLDSEEDRRELRLIMVLSRAWEKMALAKGKASPGIFVQAAGLFEEAKSLSLTEKTSLWALGNSSFCKGLAAKLQFQNTFEKSYHSEASKHLKQAANYYAKAGFENASDYAKGTQRLFEAYVYMSSAEGELDPEKKAKFYQFAEQLLEVAASLFVKAKHVERTSEVHKLLASVREEKALASSLITAMQAPSIASSTLSFSAPTPTHEVSVGLENFEQANVQANLVVGLKEVRVGESFCLSVEFVNAGKEPALLTRVEDFVPPDFIVVKKPEIYRLEDSCLNMKGKQIAPLKLVEAKLVLQPSQKGVYKLKPTVHYLDELGQNKSLQLKSVEIKVEEVIFADRVSTGTKELDSLLLGGIPEGYAVVLTGSPSDEREMLIKNFLEAGVGEGQTSFYVTTEAVRLGNLLEKTNFYLFVCTPKPKVEVPDLPNVYRLRGKTDLNNLNMALMKAYRNVESSLQKRICIGIVSDVLVDYGVKAARKWISELTTDLVSRGFTVLAVMNPAMHPSDQATGIIDLFDGEISLTQAEDPLECKKSVVVRKLRNQDFITNSICLSKSR